MVKAIVNEAPATPHTAEQIKKIGIRLIDAIDEIDGAKCYVDCAAELVRDLINKPADPDRTHLALVAVIERIEKDLREAVRVLNDVRHKPPFSHGKLDAAQPAQEVAS